MQRGKEGSAVVKIKNQRRTAQVGWWWWGGGWGAGGGAALREGARGKKGDPAHPTVK